MDGTYICIRDCGFYFGDECKIINEVNNYYIMQNQYGENNVFTKDEFNKYFKKYNIKDIEHSCKFYKLRDELSNTKSNICFDEEKGSEYFNKGLELYKNKNHKESIECFLKSINYDKTSYYNIGLCYYKLKQYDEALKYYFKMLNICEVDNKYNISKLSTIYNIGVVYDKLNELEKSLYYINKAYELDDTDEDVLKAIKLIKSKINEGE